MEMQFIIEHYTEIFYTVRTQNEDPTEKVDVFLVSNQYQLKRDLHL